MITDRQVRRLRKLMKRERTLSSAASRTKMDEKTARKYLKLGKLPSEIMKDHTWRTRKDPFIEVWDEIKSKLILNPGLESKTLFMYLQRKYHDKYFDGQLRTLQRRIKQWRALEGPSKEVFFPQLHRPGELAQSDFTNMDDLGITIYGEPFNHLIYHFVLTYSNWETGSICFSECFESLSYGLQSALWELGGVPKAHQTDRLTTAVQKASHPEEFTQRYLALIKHYGLEGRKTQANRPNENGDVEQRHHRFKRALEQQLMLRGSRDFKSRDEYECFLKELFYQLNSGRKKRLDEELKLLRRLPLNRLDTCKRMTVNVTSNSIIRVYNNTYSVDSGLIGEKVCIKLYAEHLEVWYAQKCIEKIPRLRGDGKHFIQYRHIIDSLIKKPGAFENYKYREDLFPTINFRMAYDYLKKDHSTQKASKEYLKILYLAAKEGEDLVDYFLDALFTTVGFHPIYASEIEELIRLHRNNLKNKPQIDIAKVDLEEYDALLEGKEVTLCQKN
jgi:transposase